MPVVLKFQSTGSVPGDGAPIAMRGSSMTIGRGDENDLALPDPDRTISKRHCVIEDHNGNVVVVDISTNGTFLNYGKLALGATPTPLNDGDILLLGPYEVMVSIPKEGRTDDIAAPLDDMPVSHGQAQHAPRNADLLDAPGDGGDFLDDLLDGRDGPVGPSGVDRSEPDEDGLLAPFGDDDDLLPPLEPEEDQRQGASDSFHSPSTQDQMSSPKVASAAQPLIPDDWEDDVFAPSGAVATSGPSDPFAKPAQNESDGVDGGSAFIPDDFDLPDTPAQVAPQTTPHSASPQNTRVKTAAPSASIPVTAAEEPAQEQEQAPANCETEAAAKAFLKALHADDITIHPDDLPATMERMGNVMRLMIEGMREILMTRTSIKSEFRIEQTMISSGNNNPLKFSISAEQAIQAMVRPPVKGYLEATEATEQALKDIKAHEVAMITGMESALHGILKRLDPKALEGRIVTGGGLGSVLKSRKARYWEIYETMYAEISDQAENDFQELFAREFARAYTEQLDKLK